jgi:hypothetical protein
MMMSRGAMKMSKLTQVLILVAAFMVSCSSGGGGGTGGNGTPGPGTPPANSGFLPTGIVIDGAYVVEGDSATQEVQLHVRLTKTYAAAVTVDWETVDSSAIGGLDYLVSSGSLTYSPGETDKVITVTVTGDLIAEPTAMEAFKVALSNAQNAPLGTATAFVSIEDDDRTVVGADGGILRLAGGMIQLHALAGALASDTALTAAATADADPLFVGSAYLISSPAATIFTGHVELSITYDPADITALGGVEGDLVIGQWTGVALQSISGSWTDTTAKTVSVSIEGTGTYVVMDGRNKRTNIAYVVNTPVLPNEFLTVPEAVTYVCLSGPGRVVIKRSSVTIGSFTPGCDVTLEPEAGTPVTVAGATTISSASPMTFTGFAFSGAVSFIAGDDLLLRGNQFASTVSVLLDAAPLVLSGKASAAIMAAPAAGCSHQGNVQYRENAAAGPLSVAVAAGTSYCGKTTVSDAILPTFVATASGNANLTGEARLELNRLGVQDVTVTANVEGNARVFLGSVDTGKIAANLNIPAGISGPRLDSLNVNSSTSVDVGLDGGGILTLSHKGLSVREGYGFSLLDDAFQGEVYGDVSAASVGKLKAEVGGKARWNLSGGVAVQGSATYGVEAGLVDGVVANSDVSYQAGVHIDGTKLPLSVPFDLSFAGGSSSDVRGTVAVLGIGGSFKSRPTSAARAPMTAPAVPAGLNIEGFTIMPAGVTGPLENGVHIDADDRTDPIEVKNNIYRVGQANAIVVQNAKGTVLIQGNTIEEANYGIALEKVSTPVTIDNNTITASFGIVAGNDVQQVTATNNAITADMMGIYLTGTSSSGLRRATATGNSITMPGESEGALVLMSSTVLDFHSNTVTGSVILTAIGYSAYATVVGNTIEPGHLIDNPFAPTLITDPAGQSLDPELEIQSMVDWSGNLCADYPPSLDLRANDPGEPIHDGSGACIGEDGVSPPVAPI